MVKPCQNFFSLDKARGIALVAVLAVLVVLALLASLFTVHMQVESKMGNVQIAKLQADLIAESAIEHALCVIREDALEQPAWDDKTEEIFTAFAPDPQNPTNNADIDGVKIDEFDIGDGKWIYVKNKNGEAIGRYAILIEDEAAKININTARALNNKMQNEGFGNFEVMLTDGKSAGLPVSLSFAKKIIRYRYGRDLAPGQKNVDDNLTESSYASDLIDNDADGIVDEHGEGIDEPEEYNPFSPKWDDRSFSSIKEACNVIPKKTKLDATAMRYLSKFGTVYSKSGNLFYDEEKKSQDKKVNLNVASKKQLNAMLRKANAESRFESKSRNMRMLVGNITDYRDENSVLSTMGSEYGVEAVCFNEVMSNDGSYTLRFDRNDDYWEGKNRVYRFGWFYERPDKGYHKSYGWKITYVGPMLANRIPSLVNGKLKKISKAAWVKLSEFPNKKPKNFIKFKGLMRKNGGWPLDLWKNAWLVVWGGSKGYGETFAFYPIIANSSDKLLVGLDDDINPKLSYDFLASRVNSTTNNVYINNLWRDNNGGLTVVFPEMSDSFFFPVFSDSNLKRPPKNLYYKVYVGENNLPGNIMDPKPENAYNSTYIVFPGDHDVRASATPWKGFNEMLDLDGDPSKYSETKMMDISSEDLVGSTLKLPDNQSKVWLLRTPYQDGKPIRAKNGWINLTISTCRKTGYVGGIKSTSDKKAYQNKNVIVSAYMIRPDIVELINISDHPVSLKNWRIVINTGSYADQVGRIDVATLYSKWRQGLYDDPNPTIQPNGYFYITNNRKIFDKEYGAPKDGTWGNSASERYPCVDIPDTLWGIRYKVASIKRGSGNRGDSIICEGAHWRKDQMKYEMSEWYLRKPRPDQNSSMGVRLTVKGNTRNGLYMGDNLRVSSLKAGDDILLLGMPREGGFLSMTLKNQYDQISARTVDYGTTKLGEINYSTEKLDPTHYNWIKSRKATFGGTERKARNHAQPRGNVIKPFVKDNRFVSVGEIQKVRKAEDWQNIGMQKKGHSNTRTLKAIAKYLTSSGIRLDPEEEGAHISGWQPAFGKSKFSSAVKVSANGVQWEPNIWEKQFLRVVSGKQKGEKYVIKSSSENSVSVVGYSLPSGKQLKIHAGDKFSVGPGYSTPLYYTRKNGDEGIWEWKNKGLSKNNYGLYLFGLNDSIDTTEFLEENNNARLTVSAYNFNTRQFDRIPLPNDRSMKRSDSAYKYVTGKKTHQYEKSDGVYCGLIHPCHISPDGGVKLKITAGGLGSKNNSGFAWFDYAFLAPGEEPGKININTAPERVLRSLNGISEELAKNIYEGITSDGKKELKPYKNITDILDVKKFSSDLFSKNANLITTRSDQFRVMVIAQSLNPAKKDFSSKDSVIAQTKREIIVDRSELTDDNPKTSHFKISFGN